MEDKYKNGYILINKNNRRQDSYQITTKHEILKNEYVRIKVFDDYLIISIATIDYNGKTHAPSSNKRQIEWMSITVKDERLRIGKFNIDEESNEDDVIVYFDQELQKK